MLHMTALMQGDGLTLSEIIRDLPHDGPALVVYALILLFIWFVWRGSRSRAG